MLVFYIMGAIKARKPEEVLSHAADGFLKVRDLTLALPDFQKKA